MAALCVTRCKKFEGLKKIMTGFCSTVSFIRYGTVIYFTVFPIKLDKKLLQKICITQLKETFFHIVHVSIDILDEQILCLM